MFNLPFTSTDDLDTMTLFQQAQHRAEEETDTFTLTKLEGFTMATPEKKTLSKKPAATAAAKPAATAKKGFGPRQIPDGHIGLEALAKEFKTTTAILRRKLRGSEISKPEAGWVFKDGSKELAAVRKFLTPAEKKAA